MLMHVGHDEVKDDVKKEKLKDHKSLWYLSFINLSNTL